MNASQLNIAGFDISFPILSHFALDGGSMFGAVPKKLWEKCIQPDEQNRIAMVTRGLLLRREGDCILVDLGLGDKWDKKREEIFQIKNIPEDKLPFKKTEVSHIILTHFHFDHVGGISHFDQSGTAQLSYPNAKYFVQEANYALAKNPNAREKASYLKENVEVLKSADLTLTNGSEEILPGLFVHRIDGHTEGQQIVEVRDELQNLFFFADLVPTCHHVPLPYHMGYDMHAAKLLEEKEHFLSRVVQEDSLVVFQHEAKTPFGKIQRDERAGFSFCPEGF